MKRVNVALEGLQSYQGGLEGWNVELETEGASKNFVGCYLH
jgi:hypothetical protein